MQNANSASVSMNPKDPQIPTEMEGLPPPEAKEGSCQSRPRCRKISIAIGALVAIVVVILALIFGLIKDNNNKIKGTWYQILAPQSVAKLWLTDNGRRLFLAPHRGSSLEAEAVACSYVYEQNQTEWQKHSEIFCPGQAIPTLDGRHVAIWSLENITVLRETNGTDPAWEPMGSPITPSSLLPTNSSWNASEVSFWIRDMVLSEDGQLLTIWTKLGGMPFQPDAPHGVLASFRFQAQEEDWLLLDQAKSGELFDYAIHSGSMSFRTYLAASGQAVALGLYAMGDEFEGGGLEHMNVYEHNLATKWSLVNTFVEPAGQWFDSRFGQAGSISYDGSVVAVSAPNLQRSTSRFRYGLVQVHEKGPGGSYLPKGKALDPPRDCVIGTSVALSANGNRLAINYDCYHDYVQTYEFQGGKWKALGNPIRSPRGNGVQDISMAEDGSRIAIAWSGGTALYELQQ